MDRPSALRGAVAAAAAVIALGVTVSACSSGAASKPAVGAPSSRPHPALSTVSLDPAASNSSVPAADRGVVVSRNIPVPRSQFQARPTLIYVPAVARRDKHAHVPVIELLHGTPGSPQDWFTQGHVEAVMDAYAAAHGGRAPLVVVPDINGGPEADTECIASKDGGDVEGYLSTELPDYVIRHFPVTTDRQKWAVVGNSEGGTCAAMLALRYPADYAVFGDFSGLAHLTVGPTNNPPATIKDLFNGSRADYLTHDPVWMLQHAPDTRVRCFFRAGASDTATVRGTAELAADASKAGLITDVGTIPGGHTWPVWHQALIEFLPWFALQTT